MDKTVLVPFLINKLNQELLLNGTSIDNINEIIINRCFT